MAKDVAETPDYSAAYEMIKRLDEGEKLTRLIDGSGQMREMVIKRIKLIGSLNRNQRLIFPASKTSRRFLTRIWTDPCRHD